MANYRYAKVEVQDTEYGFRLIAIRPTPNSNQHVRIACYAFPFYRSGASIDGGGGGLIHVPADDETSFRIFIQCRPNRPFSPGERTQLDTMHMWLERDGKTRRNRLDNDYHIDRVAQKSTDLAGIGPTINEQDYAFTESMGPIMDRTKEHLYSGDAAVIRLRQMLSAAARTLREGVEPPALDPSIPFHKIHSTEIIIGPEDDPWLIPTDAGETARRAVALAPTVRIQADS